MQEENFSKLKERVWESLEKTDLKNIQRLLQEIKEPTLITGVGGSRVVSAYLAKVLNKKNKIITEDISPRDTLYKDIQAYKNIIACSYSGNNYGVKTSFKNNLKPYLLSHNSLDGINNLTYFVKDIEHSFISLSSTLIPVSIILAYYLDNDLTIIEDILKEYQFNVTNNLVYEIMSGYESNISSKFLESTMVESGIAIPIVHDKYDYCHGRSTLSYHYNHSLIFFNTLNELDLLYQEQLPKYYANTIELVQKYNDNIINDYYFLVQCMYLCKAIAEKKKMDLSKVKYSPLVRKLYYYEGKM